jgi:hypothetical protein
VSPSRLGALHPGAHSSVRGKGAKSTGRHAHIVVEIALCRSLETSEGACRRLPGYCETSALQRRRCLGLLLGTAGAYNAFIMNWASRVTCTTHACPHSWRGVCDRHSDSCRLPLRSHALLRHPGATASRVAACCALRSEELLRSSLPASLQGADAATAYVRPSWHIVQDKMLQAQLALYNIADIKNSAENYTAAVCRTVGVLSEMETLRREASMVHQDWLVRKATKSIPASLSWVALLKQ